MQPAFAPAITKKGFSREMENKGFKARLQRAPRLVGNGVFDLPAGDPVEVYPVDALPGCPEDWVRGQGSYVCPVSPDWGLWFDWTCNDHYNTAIMASVKGMNPVTGQKIENLSLEKYDEKCPIHGDALKTGLLCEKCGFKWPPQSYVCFPNQLWWDGFRQPDGTVRQFFFTADEERDVASAVIGKRNVVPAFGFAFFEPVERRVVQQQVMRSAGGSLQGSYSVPDMKFYTTSVTPPLPNIPLSFKPKKYGGKKGGPHSDDAFRRYLAERANDSFHSKGFAESDVCVRPDGAQISCNSVVPDQNMNQTMFNAPAREDQAVDWSNGILLADCDEEQVASVVEATRSVIPAGINLVNKSVAVGAGAQIKQDLDPDNLSGGWKKKPSALIRLYFVFQPQFEDIFKKGGLKDLDGDKQGYLKGVKVG